jgi:WD40 repeat protein
LAITNYLIPNYLITATKTDLLLWNLSKRKLVWKKRVYEQVGEIKTISVYNKLLLIGTHTGLYITELSSRNIITILNVRPTTEFSTPSMTCTAMNDITICCGTNLCDILIMTQKASKCVQHSGRVNVVKLVGGVHRSLLSAGDDQLIYRWNSTTGEVLQCYEGHSGYISDIAGNLAANAVLSCANDNTVKRWNYRTGIVEYSMDKIPNPCKLCYTYDHRSYIGTKDGIVFELDMVNNKIIKEYVITDTPIVHIQDNTTELCVVGKDGNIFILNKTKEDINVLSSLDDIVSACKIAI